VSSDLFGLKASDIQEIQSIFAKSPDIEKVLIYGSRAKGNYKEGSDIDLTIFAPKWKLDNLLRIENEIDDLMLPYKVDLSLHHHIDNAELLDHIKRVAKVFYNSKALSR
jgi:predicted nucleotidyltransferase